MGWSEPENVHFLSHDIRCVLYIVFNIATFALTLISVYIQLLDYGFYLSPSCL